MTIEDDIKSLKKEEKDWIGKIDICEVCTEAIYRHVAKNGEHSLLILEDILIELHEKECAFRSELMYLRLEKSRWLHQRIRRFK